MKKTFKIGMFFLGIVFCFAKSVDMTSTKKSLTPHEIIESDDLTAFRGLWRKAFADLSQNQCYCAELPQQDRERVIYLVIKYQWAPLMLKQAEELGSRSIASFLRFDCNVKLSGDGYREEDLINAQKVISVIRVGPLW